MKIIFIFILVLISRVCSNNYSKKIAKRQAFFDELINGALKLVQPIFDTGQHYPESPIIPKKSSNANRETKILGAPDNSGLENVPICRGDSKICKFISCAAHNFKQDESFANLNLAAQVLGDQKLRKAISNNPEAITAVCREQGLSQSQCKLFSQGFRIIDRFMTTIEKPANEPADHFMEHPEVDDPTAVVEHLQDHRGTKKSTMDDLPNQNQKPQSDAMVMPIRPVNSFASRNKIFGSRTWSTHEYSLKNEIHSRPPPIMAIVTTHTAEKRAPFPMEFVYGGIAKKMDTPFARAPPPKTIYTSKYAKISEKTNPIVPRPKRHLFEDGFIGKRAKREADYYDELEERESNRGRNDPLILNDAMADSSISGARFISTSTSRQDYQRLNCIQYVVDL